MFSGFHGRSSASSVQLAQHSALEQRLAALQDDNAQLRTMYKHLETQLSMASAELGCEHSRDVLSLPQPCLLITSAVQGWCPLLHKMHAAGMRVHCSHNLTAVCFLQLAA